MNFENEKTINNLLDDLIEVVFPDFDEESKKEVKISLLGRLINIRIFGVDNEREPVKDIFKNNTKLMDLILDEE